MAIPNLPSWPHFPCFSPISDLCSGLVRTLVSVFLYRISIKYKYIYKYIYVFIQNWYNQFPSGPLLPSSVLHSLSYVSTAKKQGICWKNYKINLRRVFDLSFKIHSLHCCVQQVISIFNYQEQSKRILPHLQVSNPYPQYRQKGTKAAENSHKQLNIFQLTI